MIKQQVEPVKTNWKPPVDNGAPTEAAGSMSMIRTPIEAPAFLAHVPQLLIEEPSWILCGEFCQPCYVFVPAGV
ncbi:MAG: hypothetical protein ACI8UO_004389 [Verrucomicrobiales bacterium]